jgi:hypothetical protein
MARLGARPFWSSTKPRLIRAISRSPSHALLVRRADDLEGCSEGSRERAELASIVYAIEAYEGKRWPLGKEPGGKG